MSQAIKKLEGGGSVSQTEQKPKEETPQVRTFRLGEREIEANSLLRNADSNVESYLESTGWSSKKKNAFRETYSKYLQGINSGTISSRDVGRNWIDSTGQLANTSGKGFDANGAVAHYLDSIADAIPDYVKEEKVQPTATKKSLNFGAGLNQSLLDKFFGGNRYNQSVWYSRDTLDETTKKRGVANRLKDFSGQFSAYADSLLNDPEFDTKYDLSNTAFKNKDEFRNRIERAKAVLSNDKLEDEDWRALSELGINVEGYRDWFGDTDIQAGAQPEVKKDNFKGTPLEDLSKVNTKLTDAGYLARTDDKGNVFYLNPDGTEIKNGVIGEAFNPKTDSLAGWFRVNGNIYNPSEYSNWSPEVKNAYNIILNEQDDKNIYDDPIYGELKDKYGYSHVADASLFFDNFNGELVKAYTRPTVENPTGSKSQYFLNKNGKFTPVNITYNDILGEWVANDNGTTIRLGKQREAGTQPISGSDAKVGFNKVRQYTFSGKDAYTQDNILGLLRRLGDNPNLANDARYRSFIQGLFLPGRLDSMKSEEGIPLTDLIKEGRIDFRLLPNETKRGLRILRDSQGRVTNLTFDTGDGPHSSGSPLGGTGWKGFKPIKTDYNASPLKRKEGGIIKAQWGVSTDYIVDRRKPATELNDEEKKLNKKATDSYDKTQSIKFDNKDLTDAGGIIKTSDRVKMGAAMADLLSAGLGFVPGANIASAGIGAASSLAEFGADASDGLEWGDVGNLALNLGMDAVSLIPAMKSIKAAKAMSKLAKFVPLIATAIGASSLFNDQERESLTSSLKKVTSGNIKDLSTDDFKNLATISRVVLGGKNFLKSQDGKIMSRLRGTKRAPSTKQEISVVVKGRENPIKVQVNNADIEGKDANYIQDLAKKKAKKILANEGLVEKNIPDDALSVETKGTDKWYKGSFLNKKKVPTKKVPGFEYSKPNWVQRHLVPQSSETPKNFGQFWGMRGINPNGRLGWLSDTRWLEGTTPRGEVKMLVGKPNAEIKGNLLNPSQRRQRLQNKGLTTEELNKRGIYKQGGIIKAQGGRKISNVVSSANWGTDIYGTEGFNNWLNSYNLKNYQDFNNLQKSYYGNLSTTGYKPGTSPVSYNQGVYDRQTTFNKVAPGVNAAIEGLAKTGKITRAGVSGDNATSNFTDGYFGGQEYLRHGGMRGVTSDEQLKAINALANKKGLEYYIDDATGMAMLRPSALQAPIAPKFNTQTIDTSKAVINPTTGKVSGLPNVGGAAPAKVTPSETRGTTSGGGIRRILGNLDPTAFIQAGRMMGNIWNNNRVAAKTKEGLKPLLLDTYETPRQIVGDLATRQAYNNQAAQLESLAARPRTSDASLQLAGELEANSRANQLRTEGALADNDMIRRTGEAAWQNNAEAVARRSEVANRNRASMLGIDKAKKDIDAAKMSANWTSVENFMKEREYKAAMDRDRQRQFNLNVGMSDIQAGTEARLKPLRDYLEQQSLKGVDISTLPQYKQYSDLIESLGRENVQAQNQLYSDVYGLRMPRGRWSPVIRKRGGQLTYAERSRLQAQKDTSKAKTENAKLFQKNIEKTIDTNIKMINNLSSVSKQLIIKSMT
jgi:hypothetical protein|nr:MAG TPA: hypothetical protein [Bacteriophage sp.]